MIMLLNVKEAQPLREEFPNPDGSMVVQVTQAKLFAPEGAKPVRVYLTKPEYKAYREWLDKGGRIQDLLPHISASQREMLLTGIGGEEFADIVKALDEEFLDPEEDADDSHPSLQAPVFHHCTCGIMTGTCTCGTEGQQPKPKLEVCDRCGILKRPKADADHLCGDCGEEI